MTIFCLLFVPLFYLFYRTFSHGGSHGVWALMLGSITAIIQFFLGNIIDPGGFGFSRIVFGFFDIACFPVLLPVFVYLILLIFKRFSVNVDFANFALIWLIPIGALRALSWTSTNDPILLILAPLLWVSLAVGISFFIDLTKNHFRWYTLIIAIICIPVLPAAASLSYWSFFSQQNLYGFSLLGVMFMPVIAAVIVGARRSSN